MKNRISELIIKQLDRSMTAAEFAELEQWIDSSPDNQQLFIDILTAYKKTLTLDYIEQDISAKIKANKALALKRINRRKRLLWVSSVAAIFIVGIISSSLLMFNKNERPETITPTTKVSMDHIALRPSEKGVVLVESGQEVHISDSIGKYIHKGIEVTKNSLDYSKSSTQTVNVISTLSIPKGKRFQLTLSDGTKLWINSNTEVEYPSQFEGDTRRIKVKGEVYLDVAHNPSKPFIVEVFNTEIKVLGTRFNVMAYPESSDVVTTLLEGSVVVNDDKILAPNEQLSFNKHTSKSTLSHVEGDSAIGWINGVYRFNNMKLEDLVKLFNLVYSVEIEIESRKSLAKIFTGSIHDTIPYDEMFQLIMKTTNIEYVIDKGKIKIW